MPFATTPTEQHLADVLQRLTTAADDADAARVAFAEGRVDDALTLLRRLPLDLAAAGDARREALATAEEEQGRRLLGADQDAVGDRLCRACGLLRPSAAFTVPHNPKPAHACVACRG